MNVLIIMNNNIVSRLTAQTNTMPWNREINLKNSFRECLAINEQPWSLKAADLYKMLVRVKSHDLIKNNFWGVSPILQKMLCKMRAETHLRSNSQCWKRGRERGGRKSLIYKTWKSLSTDVGLVLGHHVWEEIEKSVNWAMQLLHKMWGNAKKQFDRLTICKLKLGIYFAHSDTLFTLGKGCKKQSEQGWNGQTALLMIWRVSCQLNLES